MKGVEGKIHQCKKKLQWWSRMVFGNIIRSLKDKKEKLRKAEDLEI